MKKECHYNRIFFMIITLCLITYLKEKFPWQRLGKKTEKWIVITTNSSWTKSVNAYTVLKEWQVVIVANMKTPIVEKLANCHFLSTDMQTDLNFAIFEFVPNNSYGRKMIGYLYAIKNGAKWIYDTDENIYLRDSDLFIFDTNTSSITGISYGTQNFEKNKKRALFNPYSFWGQSTMWPRGYPLEDVKTENEQKQFNLCKHQKTPAIQQGLVRKDPDVDAVYRLLHANEEHGLNVNFSEHAPPIIVNPGSFCPFNSQNTLFHYDAFWSLFLPVSVNFRVTDIWRGYFTQALLHLTGHRLGFYPANAVQKRNAHSYLADFKDETQIYADAGRMVDFISNWTCKFELFEDCFKQLSNDFFDNRFWAKLDVELIKAWITDLKTIGYKFPSLINYRTTDSIPNVSQNCRRAGLQFTANKKYHIEKKKLNFAELKDWCNKALPVSEALSHRYSDEKSDKKGLLKTLSRLVLIVTGNYPFESSISILQKLYEHHFASVIFCGTVEENNIVKTSNFPRMQEFSFINVTVDEIRKGFRAYMCTSKAIEMRLQNIDGYVTIADDTVYNFFNDFDYNRFRLAYIEPYKSGDFSWWDDEIAGKNAMRTAVEMIKNETKQNSDSTFSKAFKEYSKGIPGDVFSVLKKEYVWSISDFYYLPKTNENIFYEFAELFFEANLFHEIAVSKIAAGLQWFSFYNSSKKDIIDVSHLIQTAERIEWPKFYKKDLLYLHPIKISSMHNLTERKLYCNTVIRNYLTSLAD